MKPSRAFSTASRHGWTDAPILASGIVVGHVSTTVFAVMVTFEVTRP
jgi:hypothetical protein